MVVPFGLLLVTIVLSVRLRFADSEHTANNYPTKLRLKVKFFWFDKNGVVGSKLSLK
jgi:uncharacterized protein YcfL